MLCGETERALELGWDGDMAAFAQREAEAAAAAQAEEDAARATAPALARAGPGGVVGAVVPSRWTCIL